MGSWRCKLWTFLIGMVAGAAPFLCMSYLPHLLDPRAAVTRPDVAALVVVGILVGVVTVIMDSRRFDQEDPREVLMRSLAIPSILLATVTGLQSRQAVGEQRTQASAMVDTSSADVNIIPLTVPLQEVGPASKSNGMSGWLWAPSEAQAQPRPPMARRAVIQPAQEVDYLVVLGTYTNEKEARRAAERWDGRDALATERYYQKSVRVFGAGPQVFYVSYTTPLPRSEAVKLYKLLRINDPNITPQLAHLVQPSAVSGP